MIHLILLPLLLLHLFHNTTSTILENPLNHTVLATNPYGHNDTSVFSKAILGLQTGGALYISDGIYFGNSSHIIWPISTDIFADNLDYRGGFYENFGTRIYFTNGGSWQIGQLDTMKNIVLNFTKKTDSSDSYTISGNNWRIQDVVVDGPYNVPGTHFIGSTSNPVGNGYIDNLQQFDSNYGIKFDNASNNIIERMHVQNYYVGVQFCNTDNNVVNYIQFNNANPATWKTDLMLGCSASDGTGANPFFNPNFQVRDTNIVSNANYTLSTSIGATPNVIFYASGDGKLNTQFNNNSTAQVIIEHTSDPKLNGK